MYWIGFCFILLVFRASLCQPINQYELDDYPEDTSNNPNLHISLLSGNQRNGHNLKQRKGRQRMRNKYNKNKSSIEKDFSSRSSDESNTSFLETILEANVARFQHLENGMRTMAKKLMQLEEAIAMVRKSPGAKELICKSHYVAPYRCKHDQRCPCGTMPHTFIQKLCAPGKNQP